MGAGAVIFESAATRALYDDRAPGRTVVVPYGVDTAALDRFAVTTTRSEARLALDLPESGKLLLAVGTLEPRKNQTLLVEAFAQVAGRHPDATLALVGDLATPYSGALHEFVARAGLGHRVRVAPVTPDVAAWYRAADALVCTSDVESLPRSVLDAMCLGLPIVATNVFGLAELLTDGETGLLFEPNDLRSAITALDRVLSMEPRRLAAIATRGSALVHEQHDASGYAADVLALLRGLHADPAASPSALLAVAVGCPTRRGLQREGIARHLRLRAVILVHAHLDEPRAGASLSGAAAQPQDGGRPATTTAVSYSSKVIRTTPASKSARASPTGSICDSTAPIGTGGSHSSARLSTTPLDVSAREACGFRRAPHVDGGGDLDAGHELPHRRSEVHQGDVVLRERSAVPLVDVDLPHPSAHEAERPLEHR